jgi:hypothetical protein
MVLAHQFVVNNYLLINKQCRAGESSPFLLFAADLR